MIPTLRFPVVIKAQLVHGFLDDKELTEDAEGGT